MEDGTGWNVKVASPAHVRAHPLNRSLAGLLVLRGRGALEVDASDLSNPALHPAWAPDPLLVAASPAHFASCEMAAVMLCNDQVWFAPSPGPRVTLAESG